MEYSHHIKEMEIDSPPDMDLSVDGIAKFTLRAGGRVKFVDMKITNWSDSSYEFRPTEAGLRAMEAWPQRPN